MKRILLWLGLVALAGLLATAAQADPQGPAGRGTLADPTHPWITNYEGPQTCTHCHGTAGNEVVNSLHYQQQGPAPFRVGWPAGKTGGMFVTY